MADDKKHGGARENAGRPKEDEKIRVQIDKEIWEALKPLYNEALKDKKNND